jgi:anhydro-N-acetylmuramic acid kinase
MIREMGIPVEDALRTYTEHIALQIKLALTGLVKPVITVPDNAQATPSSGQKLLVTGGGAHNVFLTGRLQELLEPLNIEVVVPDKGLVDYKEALVMALIGVLRWREENTVLASVTGASRDSIGGAIWIGQEA